MSKKKQPRNGFYYYMLDFKQQQHHANFSNMRAVAEAAGPHWQKMNAQERAVYDQKAKCNRNNTRIVKYTTKGVDVEVIKRAEREQQMKEQSMKEDIETTLKLAMESGRIHEQPFYFIHFNYYCFYTNDKTYEPAEVGITKFTLGEGVKPEDVYHAIISSDSLRIGYASQAKAISEETHQLEPPNSLDKKESNLHQIMDCVAQYILGNNVDRRNVPPVFARDKNMEVTESILNKYANDTPLGPINYKVYSMEYFFYVLRNVVGENVGKHMVFHALSMSQMELEKDVYDFCGEIPCPYHKLSDVPNHCSRSHVIRCAYVMCDHCCADLGIDLIPGRHVPMQSKVPGSRASSRMSAASSSRKPAKTTDPLLGGYLSPAESESDISSVANSYDVGVLDSCDSESNPADSEGWTVAKSRHKRNTNLGGACSLGYINSGPTLEWVSSEPSGSNADALRRPQARSAAMHAAESQDGCLMPDTSSSPGPGPGPSRMVRGRGRGSMLGSDLIRKPRF